VFFAHDGEIRKIDLVSTVITSIGEGHSPFVLRSGEVLASLAGIGLVKYSSNGATRTTIVSSTQDISDPQLSPDGQRIAFASGVNTYIVTATGETIDSVINAVRPQWLSDAKLIIQQGDELLGFDMQTRTSNMIAKIGSGRDAAVSPDHSRIAFVEGKDLFTMNVDGSNLMIIMSGHTELRYPEWSRDGKNIVVKDGCDLKLFKVSGGMVQSFRGHFFSFTNAQCPDGGQLNWK
jgi:hypothetical protein